MRINKHMKNVTISMDETLLERPQAYAKGHHTALNNLIRTTLERTVSGSQRGANMHSFVELSAEKSGDSGGETWTRDDLYDV